MSPPAGVAVVETPIAKEREQQQRQTNCVNIVQAQSSPLVDNVEKSYYSNQQVRKITYFHSSQLSKGICALSFAIISSSHVYATIIVHFQMLFASHCLLQCFQLYRSLS